VKKRCEKTCYASLGAARRAILSMAWKYDSVFYRKAYRCATCKAWHITSTPPPRGRRIRR
jgi:hypothetical protein